MILFLNKKDVFEQKIATSPLNVIFTDYEGEYKHSVSSQQGGQDYYKASEFIKWQFISLNESIERQVYPHFTCATDKDAMKFVMDSVLQIIVQQNLEGLGLM